MSMAETTNYQCPHCLGPLHFSSESGKLECEYCGSSYSPKELAAINQKATEAASEPHVLENSDGWGDDEKNMRVCTCSSCGAELICDRNTAATSCPYCGNPTIIPGQFHGILKPNYVIPFQYNKESAVKALKKHYLHKLLLPNVFAAENHIQEIKGIYVPFWLFDLDAEGKMTYHGSHSTVTREGNYQVTTTTHYSIHRDGSMVFEKVPVDGSSKMPDELMDSIEPYDYSGLVPFTTAYLPGYLADKYDVNAKQSYLRAMERSKASTLDAFLNTVTGYSDVRITDQNLNLREKKLSYALLPVWLLTTRWKDHTYLFAMNGQTGKMVGDLPVDPRKKALLFFGSFAAVSLLLSLTLAGQLGIWISSFFQMFF